MTKEVMREALTRIAEGNLGEAPWQANYVAIKRIATEALAQPEREPLTDEQRKDLMNKAWDKWLSGEDDNHPFAWHFSFEVEAAHGIKGKA